jgi:hypothetical protein
MSDSHAPHLRNQVDRYVHDELTGIEARALAQKSLDDPELFEELTFLGVAKATPSTTPAAQHSQHPAAGSVTRLPSRGRVFLAWAGATAAILVLSIYFLRPTWLKPTPPSLVRNEGRESVSSPLHPTLSLSAGAIEPLLLSGELQGGLNRRAAPLFRTGEADSRLPRPAGSIVSIEDNLAVVDLGSLDGVARGSELLVFRDDRLTQPAGRLTISTVFRERSRGQISAGQELHVNDHVRVADATYLAALSEQVDALADRGDSDAAIKMAQTAVAWANNAKIVSSESRKVLGRLAALEYQAGLLESAEMHYQAKMDTFNSGPQAPPQEQAATFNALAVLRLLRGDRDAAETLLRVAMSKSSPNEIVYAWSVNNLGVLAELQGDRSKATSLYTDALRAFTGARTASEQDRRVVETNLSRLSSTR